MSFKSIAIVATACLLFSGAFVVGAQEANKPLTNADVLKMVKSGLPESVIVLAIQSSPAKYDVSPDGLITLHKAGVTRPEMDAIMGPRGEGRPLRNPELVPQPKARRQSLQFPSRACRKFFLRKVLLPGNSRWRKPS